MLFIFFFAGSLIDYGLLPDAVNFVPELVIALLFAASLAKRGAPRTKPVGLLLVAGFVGTTALSAAWAHPSIFEVILFLRILLRFYVMFWALIQFNVPERELRWYLRVLAILFLIQIPVAAVKLPSYGVGESTIGTYATHGGGNSTAIPMIAVGFFLTYFCTYRRSAWFLLGIVAFTAFGLMGGKRAIFIVVPLTCLFAVLNANRFVTGRWRIPIHLYVLAGLIGAVAFYAGVRLSPTLTPEREIGGSFDPDHLYSYAVLGNARTTPQGDYTTGRYSTTVRSIETVAQDPVAAILGLGPGHFMKSRFSGVGRDKATDTHGTAYGGGFAEVGILYGETGFSWLLLQVGFLGAAIWLGFYAYLFIFLRRLARWESDPFWRSYYLSMVCFTFVVLFLSLAYGIFMIAGELTTFVYFLLLAIGVLHAKQTRGSGGRPGYNRPAYDWQHIGTR